jgi:hypothetical protein
LPLLDPPRTPASWGNWTREPLKRSEICAMRVWAGWVQRCCRLKSLKAEASKPASVFTLQMRYLQGKCEAQARQSTGPKQRELKMVKAEASIFAWLVRNLSGKTSSGTGQTLGSRCDIQTLTNTRVPFRTSYPGRRRLASAQCEERRKRD